MSVRILFPLLCAVLLTSCSDYYETGSSQPKMKQETHTSPMGQTIYTYRPAEGATQ